MIEINYIHAPPQQREPPTTMRPLLLFLHLAGIVIWVGGMYFAHFCLRPVATKQLPPPQRLPLMAAVLGRFFPTVALAIAAIVGSGLVLMLGAGFAGSPWHWHFMLSNGLLMTVIFMVIYGIRYPRLKQAVAAADWPAGGAAMNGIRQLVVINLLLGTLTIAVALLGPLAG